MKIILVIDLNLLYNDADPNSPNLQAATKNNPPTPHPQVHRQRCDELRCNGKVCTGLCGSFNDHNIMQTIKNDEDRNQKVKERENQYKNEINKQKETYFRKQLPKYIRDLLKIKEELNQQRQHNKKKNLRMIKKKL